MDTYNLYVPDKSCTYRVISYAVEVGSIVQKDQTLADYEIIEDRRVTRHVLKSPLDGRVGFLLAKVNSITEGSNAVLKLEESCDHSIQVRGVCAICAADLHSSQHTTISLTYDSLGVTVSPNVAAKFDKETVTRLSDQKKLALILDLDQTLIHTTVDPLIFHNCSTKLEDKGELLQFKLSNPSMVYYVKLRPGVRKFLESMAPLYEMHVYTMGTREYAVKISNILDPDGLFFNHRILAREESGSFMFKTVSRIFPCDQSMVVVVDDRSDIWKCAQNLYQVVPYEFFRGSSDINATVHCGAPEASLTQQGQSLILNFAPHEEDSNRRREEGDMSISHMDLSSIKAQQSANDTDNELEYVSSALEEIHSEYYALSGSQDPGGPRPNTCSIMSSMKLRVLSGVKIVFSGIATVGSNIADDDLWIGAQLFGAECALELDSSVTHVVSVKNDSMKAIKSKEYKGVHLVRPEWLVLSIGRWKRQNEADYLHPEVPVQHLDLIRSSVNTDENETVSTEIPRDFVDTVKGEEFESHIPREEWDKMNAEVDEALRESESASTGDSQANDTPARWPGDDMSDVNELIDAGPQQKYRRVLTSTTLSSQADQNNDDPWHELSEVLSESFANETE